MDKKIWVVKTYQDTNKIIHLTPILQYDKIVAGIEREQTPETRNKKSTITVESLKDCETDNPCWKHSLSAPKYGRIGAGRFISLKLVDKLNTISSPI